MNKEILERLNEINNELERIKKDEEIDMNMEKIIDNELNEFLEEIEECDFEIFNEYVRVTNTGASIKELFDNVTHDGWLMIIKTIVRVYVWKLYHDGNVRFSNYEKNNLAFMFNTLIKEYTTELFLQGCIFGLIAPAKKGGE